MTVSSGRANRFGLVIAAVVVILAAGEALAAPVITVMAPSCLPPQANGVVTATVQPATGLSSVRAYFRKGGSPDFYYLEMRAATGGAYWVVLPRPEEATKVVEYQIAVRDGDNRETRSDMQKVDVVASCKPVLTADQNRAAQNLVVGEMIADQKGKSVLGFLCPGIVSRIDAKGEMRNDEYCRKAVIAQTAAAGEGKRSLLVPLVIVGGAGAAVAIIKHNEKEEASRPRP